MNNDLDRALEELRSGNNAFVLVKDGKVLGAGQKTGVRELLALAEALGPIARGAALADRVVGRAAAFLAQTMELASVHALILSEPARTVLERAAIRIRADRTVPVIRNRAGDGTCPFELLLAGVEDPREAIARLRSFRPGGRAPESD